MTYVIDVHDLDGEHRHLEFEDEERALHEFHWYVNYTDAESVDLFIMRD